VSAPTRATTAGRAYLDLRNLARARSRPVDELHQLYVLETFLARLTRSDFASRLALKGGVLLAALDERRPTRDIDLQAQAVENDLETIRAMVCEIAATPVDDGVIFDTDSTTAEVIRDEEAYSGVRVAMNARLATARIRFRVDVNTGDPISPPPENVRLPRLLGGEIAIRGYPLPMVYAEKIVTAIDRGATNTRWRDFADIHLLSRRHTVDGTKLAHSIRGVAGHRRVRLIPLVDLLADYGATNQERWAIWRRRQQLEDRLPERFDEVISAVIDFADPAITGSAEGRTWDPAPGDWA
jgi:hypothetical protein